MQRPELLAPAGSYQKAKTAFLYGADAIYCGTSSLSLRTRADMENEDLIKTIKYAHEIGKKVYVTLNIFAFDDKYQEIIEMTKILEEVKPDDSQRVLQEAEERVGRLVAAESLHADPSLVPDDLHHEVGLVLPLVPDMLVHAVVGYEE